MKSSIRDALLVGAVTLLVNMATVSYWGGQVSAKLEAIAERVARIENHYIDRTKE